MKAHKELMGRPVVGTTPMDRFWAAVTFEPNSGCWLSTTTGNGPMGYGSIKVSGKTEKMHRFSYREFKGEIPAGLFVLHRCDVPSCCNPDHLMLGTQADNISDMVKKKRHTHGEAHASAILTKSMVNDIRRKRRDGMRLKQIAAEYGVAWTTVRSITLWRNWKE